MLEALGLPIPTPVRASYTLDEFIGQFAAPGGTIRAVKVHKRRTRYTVGGCMAELSDVVANGKPTRTIAVESEDAAGVMRAVRELGLGGYTNTSYPRGLAALIDDEPVRYAVIDVGTNSIKFHIGEHDVDGKWRTVVDRAELTRLGEGLAQAGRDHRRRAGANGRSDRGHGRRSEAARRAGDRRRGHGRPSDRFKRQRSHSRHPGAHRRSHRGDLGRRGRPAGLRGRQGRSRIEHRARSSSSTRAAAVPSSPSGTIRASTSASASMSVPCGTPSATGSTARFRPKCCVKPWRRFRPTSRASRDARFPTRWSQWAAR